jgi:transposase InsO family protein
MVATEWEVGRSTVYAGLRRECRLEVARKLGPKTAHSDEELTALIRAELEDSPFVGEGHRKVWARLRVAGVRTSLRRVLRLMRKAGLLAPSRQVRVLGVTTRGRSSPNGRTR